MKSEANLLKGLASVDYRYIKKLKKLLDKLKDNNALPADFDSDAASMVIYGIIMTQFFMYVYNEKTSLEELEKEIRKLFEFVFEKKCNIYKIL